MPTNHQPKQRKDFFIQQANELIGSWKDLRNYDNPMDFFEEEADMMLNLLNLLNEVNSEILPELQSVFGFYILYAPSTVNEKKMTIQVLNRLTSFILKLKSHNDLIARKQHYYEQLTDEITLMEEFEQQTCDENDSATKCILSSFDEKQNN